LNQESKLHYQNQQFMNKWFLIIGLIYVLLLGYAIFLISDEILIWHTTIIRIAYSLVIGVYVIYAIFFFLGKQAVILSSIRRFSQLLEKFKLLKVLLYILILFLPVIMVFTELSRGVLEYPLFRFLVIFPIISVTAFFWPFSDPKSYPLKILGTSIILGFIFLVGLQFQWVIDYPFTLSWSEGNRFYDYSMVFGRSIYQYDGVVDFPYFAPGRYGLWGIWFLIPNLPIWFHRLWNAFLWAFPPAFLGWFSGRSIDKKIFRLLFSLWIALFISQGPVYPTLIISAILVVAFDQVRIIRRITSTAAASFYAYLSRWTWMVAPGIWGVLLDIGMYHAERKGSRLRRILPTIMIGLAGSLPGLLAYLYRTYNPFTSQGSSLIASQPLLWYRLFPNATYSPGVLLGIIIATGSLILLMVALIFTRNWRLSLFQILVFAVALISTFFIGTIISTKIGGGSNLHNYDMYIISLVVLMMIYLEQGNKISRSWPILARILLFITIVIPVWQILKQGEPKNLPPKEEVENALSLVQEEVTQAAADGEILFLDQRQLLTFGYIENIDLIPEYEKKYMMDKAMAGNVTAFDDFYEDLESGRFAMIVSEPLKISWVDKSHGFSEENNAWVEFISTNVLCYYEPVHTLREFNIQLLVPRQEPGECK
jgi:hypothetical protein